MRSRGSPTGWWTTYFDDVMGKALFTPASWERAEKNADKVIALLGLSKGDRVLDLACGNGRYTVALAARGVEAIGLDLALPYLAEGRDRAAERGASAAFVRGDMRALPFRGAFDAALCVYTSFGYFPEDRDHVRVLREVAGALKPGGRFLLDVMSREWVVRHFQAHDWSEVDGGHLLESRTLKLEEGRIENALLYLRGGQRREYHHSVRVFTPMELRRMALETGFAEVEILADLDRTPWTVDSPRTAVLATKGAPG